MTAYTKKYLLKLLKIMIIFNILLIENNIKNNYHLR